MHPLDLKRLVVEMHIQSFSKYTLFLLDDGYALPKIRLPRSMPTNANNHAALLLIYTCLREYQAVVTIYHLVTDGMFPQSILDMDAWLPTLTMPDVQGVQWAAHAIPKREERAIEDVYLCDQFVAADQVVQLFAMADGHGGRRAGEYCLRHISSKIKDVLDEVGSINAGCVSVLQNKITDATMDLDDMFCLKRKQEYIEKWENTPDDGCTLCIAVIAGSYCIIVNLGDSRCVLFRNGDIEFVTADHSVLNDEKTRIILSNGGVFKDIVEGSLRDVDQTRLTIAGRISRHRDYITSPYGLKLKHMGMSDSFGDVLMKLEPRLFQGRPDVTVLEIPKEDAWTILLASDGLWGDFNDEDAHGQCNTLQKMLMKPTSAHERPRLAPIGNSASLKENLAQICMKSKGCFQNEFNAMRKGDDTLVMRIEIAKRANKEIKPAKRNPSTPELLPRSRQKLEPQTPVLLLAISSSTLSGSTPSTPRL